MLAQVTRKIAPLATLLTITLLGACGKQISESRPAQESRPDFQLPNPNLTLSLRSTTLTYPLPRDAHMRVPDSLRIIRGSAENKLVSIQYNVESNGYYEFRCFYRVNSEGSALLLKKCEDGFNQDLGSLESILESTFVLDQGKYIRLENSAGNLDVDAYYHIKWI